MSCSDLLTIAVERRRIAVAAYAGLRLDYLQVRELSSIADEAARSAQRFITWAFTTFNPALIAVEAPPPVRAARRLFLHAIIRGTLERQAANIIEVEPGNLRQWLSTPALRTRGQVWVIGDRLCPQLARYRRHAAAHDAALIGVHVQMTHLLSCK